MTLLVSVLKWDWGWVYSPIRGDAVWATLDKKQDRRDEEKVRCFKRKCCLLLKKKKKSNQHIVQNEKIL